MIVCHCNVLTKDDILSTLADEHFSMPRSPVQVHKCLGCAPQCGRCLATVRSILAEARASCSVGCAVCPANGHAAHDNDDLPALVPAFAAE